MSSQPSTSPASTPLKSIQVLAFSLISMVALLAIVAVALGETWDYPKAGVAWGLGALTVVVFGLCELVGYRTPAVPVDATQPEAMQLARTAFQTQLLVRFAMCELPALAGLVLFFMSSPLAPMTYLIGGVLSLVLMAIHVWPGERVIGRVERNLDRDGGRSHLGAALRGESPSARLG